MGIRSTVRGGLAALAVIAVSYTALTPVGAVAQERLTNTQINLASEGFSYSLSIPAINPTGSSLTTEKLKAILAADGTGLGELGTVTADRIAVPLISLTVVAPRDSQGLNSSTVLSLTDVVFEKVTAGRAGTMTIGSIGWGTETGITKLKGFTIRDVDIEGLLAFYGAPVRGDATRMRAITSGIGVAGGEITSQGVTCTVGAMAIGAVSARPSASSLTNLARLSAQVSATNGPVDPELTARLLQGYVGFLSGFETEGGRINDYHCKTQAVGSPLLTIGVKQMVMGAMRGGIYPEVSMSGYTIDIAGEQMLSIGKGVIKPIDLKGVIDFLRTAPSKTDSDWLAANIRSLVPSFAGFAFSDIDLNVPLAGRPGSRLKAHVLDIDVKLANYRNAIPTTVDASGFGIKFDLPPQTGNPQIETLRSLGFRQFDGAFRFAADWNEAGNTIDVKEVSLSGANLAGIMLSGEFVNATPDLFSSNTGALQTALAGLGAKSVTLNVTDAGLSQLVAQYVAGQNGTDPVAIRQALSLSATAIVTDMLAGTLSATAVARAIGSFIGGQSKTLDISAQSKSAGGLNASDLPLLQANPRDVIRRLTIDAQSR